MRASVNISFEEAAVGVAPAQPAGVDLAARHAAMALERVDEPDVAVEELTVETSSGSLHHSCRSELTRQGISLP